MDKGDEIKTTISPASTNNTLNHTIDIAPPAVRTPRLGTWKITFLCALTIVPMLAFTATLLWLIFDNLIEPDKCPFPELCPFTNNATKIDKATTYTVDYDAARLVFIASWSSSLSFTLIAVIMTVYGYITAQQWLRLSKSTPGRASTSPTPYQTSVLLRILNAEYLILLTLICRKIKEVFWHHNKSDRGLAKTPSLVRQSIWIFVSATVARYVSR